MTLRVSKNAVTEYYDIIINVLGTDFGFTNPSVETDLGSTNARNHKSSG